MECPHCNGKKVEYPDCELCNGNGWVYDTDNGGTMTCPECNNEEYSECNGDGYIEE